jgi:hypothetical protein
VVGRLRELGAGLDAELAVVLVALRGAEVLRRHRVVLERHVVARLAVAVRELERAVGALVDEDGRLEEGLRRLAALLLRPRLAVALELAAHRLGRLQVREREPDAELRHQRRRLGRDRRAEHAAPERPERPRPQLAARLPRQLAALDEPGLERLEQQLRVLVEPRPRLVLLDAQPLELALREPAADADDHAPLREVVELDELLGDERRVVPRQDDDARPELDVGRPGGDVRERLERVGDQPVAREVVLGEPHGVQPERLRQQAQLELAAEEELVGLVVDLLECCAVADVQRPASSHAAARFQPS